MAVYIINLFSVFIWQLIIKNSNVRHGDKIFIIIMTIQLFLLSSLRSFTVGIDTYNYIIRFPIVDYTSWENLPSLTEQLDFELGFIYLNKIISLFSGDPRFYLSVLNAFILTSLGVFIYKNSENICLSYFIFISLGYWGNSLNALRQFVAIAILLTSIKYIVDKKFLKFLILVLLATTIHTSAFSFIIIYPFSQIKLTKKIYSIMFIGMIFVYLFSGPITIFFMSTFGYQDLIGRLGSGSGLGMILLLILILTGSILFKNQADLKSDNFGLYMKILIVGIFLNVLALDFGMFGRAMLYYTIINIVLIPNLIHSMGIVSNKILTTSVIVLGLTYFYIFILLIVDTGGIVPYTFFFN